MEVQTVSIRSAAISWEDYQEFLDCSDDRKRVALALENPVVATSLQTFHPHAYEHLMGVENGSISPESKKGRKALRHLTTTMARAASRSTPSRLFGRVGNVVNADTQSGIILEPKWWVNQWTELKNDTSSGEDRLVRWNPSVVTAGRRSYVSVPRLKHNDPYGSVEENQLLKLVAELTKRPVHFNDVTRIVADNYGLPTLEAAEKALESLIEREFLLDESASSFTTRESRCSQTVIQASETGIDQLLQCLKAEESVSLESVRDGAVNIPSEELDKISTAYRYLLSKGLFESMGQGMAAEFAKQIHERYSFSRIRLCDLIRPGTGITYDGILQKIQKSLSKDVSRNMVRLASSRKKWVDLAADDLNLAESSEEWSTPDSFAVPIACMRGAGGERLYVACDGAPSLPADTLTARYRTRLGNSSNESSRVGVDVVGLDWTSVTPSTNAIREARPTRQRYLNVNALVSNAHGTGELTIDDIWLWSDGEHVYFEDSSGRALWFQPQSMISMMLYPDWVSLLLVSGTDGWPNMRFDWKPVENFHDRLPGVRFGNVIFARPRYLYSGGNSIDEFNAWCDAQGIGDLIRLGKMDRKVLVNRFSSAFAPAMSHLLRSGDYWVEDADCEAFGPAATLEDGTEHFFTELVVEVPFSKEIRRGAQPANPRISEEIADTKDVYLIPGVSEIANFEIIPRRGNINALLGAVHARLPQYCYFIRYYTDDGQPCIRLRILRSELSDNGFRDEFAQLLFEGRAISISETVHRLEVERYGGSEAFSWFQELFSLESHFVSLLASRGLLDSMNLETKAAFVEKWLHQLEVASNASIAKELVQLRNDGTRNELGQVEIIPEMRELWANIEGQIYQVMAEIISIGINSRGPWAAAAHMWCNRLGISNDDELRVWSFLAETLKETKTR